MKKFTFCFVAFMIFFLFCIQISFAAAGAAGKPQVKPKVIIPSEGGGGSSNEPTFDVLEPLNCADGVGFRDCYRSKSQHCDLDLPSKQEQCYSDAHTQCNSAYCTPKKK